MAPRQGAHTYQPPPGRFCDAGANNVGPLHGPRWAVDGKHSRRILNLDGTSPSRGSISSYAIVGYALREITRAQEVFSQLYTRKLYLTIRKDHGQARTRALRLAIRDSAVHYTLEPPVLPQGVKPWLLGNNAELARSGARALPSAGSTEGNDDGGATSELRSECLGGQSGT